MKPAEEWIAEQPDAMQYPHAYNTVEIKKATVEWIKQIQLDAINSASSALSDERRRAACERKYRQEDVNGWRMGNMEAIVEIGNLRMRVLGKSTDRNTNGF